MPKYYEFKVADYYLYYTSHCVVEAMHVHASNRQLKEEGSAKFWVYDDGSTKLANNNHRLKQYEINEIQKFIKKNYKEMYETWRKESQNGFYKS